MMTDLEGEAPDTLVLISLERGGGACAALAVAAKHDGLL